MNENTKSFFKLLFFTIFVIVVGNIIYNVAYNYVKRDEIKAAETYAQKERAKRIKEDQNYPDFSIPEITDIDSFFSDDVKNLTPEMLDGMLGFKPGESQKLFDEHISQKPNEKVVAEASKVYGFTIANDYKLVKYCSQYYPVNKLKQKFDNRFKDKKAKAENILLQAFGTDGLTKFKNDIVSHKNVIQAFQQEIENDYQALKNRTIKDGMKDFTRKIYCQIIDVHAEEVVNGNYRNFEKTFPNF